MTPKQQHKVMERMKDEQATLNVLCRRRIGTHHGLLANDEVLKTLGRAESIVIDGGVWVRQKFTPLRGYLREDGNPEISHDHDDTGEQPHETNLIFHIIAPKLGISSKDKNLGLKLTTLEELLRCTRWAREATNNDESLTLFIMLGGYDIGSQRVTMESVTDYVNYLVSTMSHWGTLCNAARVIWMGTGCYAKGGNVHPVAKAIHQMMHQPHWSPLSKVLAMDIERQFRKRDYGDDGKWTERIMELFLPALIRYWKEHPLIPPLAFRFRDFPPERYLVVPQDDNESQNERDNQEGGSAPTQESAGIRREREQNLTRGSSRSHNDDEAESVESAAKRVRLEDIQLPA